MDMQRVCAALLEEVDGALGCIVIDMQTGLTVAAEYRPGSSVNESIVNLVSVVSANMFGGRLMRQFEAALATEPRQGNGFVREVQMTTATTNQFMAAIPGWNEGVFVLVTDKQVSLGLGWMAVHRVIARLQSNAAPAARDTSPRPLRPARTLPHEAPPAANAGVFAAPQGQPAQPAPAAYAGAPAHAQPQQAPQVVAPPGVEHAEAARPVRRGARASLPGVEKSRKKEPERKVALGPRANFVSRK